MRTKNLFPILALALLTACSTLYDSAVTTTHVVDMAMRDWSSLSVAGKTTPQIDAGVIAAHRRYQQACAVARDALITYKAGGDQAAYQNAFEAARVAMNAVLDIILPLLTPEKAVALQSQIGKAVLP